MLFKKQIIHGDHTLALHHGFLEAKGKGKEWSTFINGRKEKVKFNGRNLLCKVLLWTQRLLFLSLRVFQAGESFTAQVNQTN